jgi:hypothetical protein
MGSNIKKSVDPAVDEVRIAESCRQFEKGAWNRNQKAPTNVSKRATKPRTTGRERTEI